MIEAALEALPVIFTPSRLMFILLGTLTGVLVGALPGLGGVVGMSLLLPFIFGMDLFDGVALMMGMISVIHTADTFPSVLLGAPGSAGSQATIMDGYPLARQGQAARALGAAFMSSLLGGLIGALTLFALLYVARPLVLMLNSPRLLMLGVLGLATVGTLVRGSALTGVLAAAAGLLIGTVGAATAAGVGTYRYTFEWLYLFDGIPLAIVALSLFAVPEIIDLLVGGESIARRAKVEAGLLRGVREVFRSKFLVLRSSVIGTGVGMLPGIGASVVDWLAYGLAERTCRSPKKFGEGDIRGVIAPESANNAKEGGALVPTLLFGIPGSATAAILMGGLLLLGIQVGPTMLSTDLPVTLSIVWTLAFANVFGTLACLLLAGVIARLTFVPAKRLMPFLIVLIVIASYQSTGNWGDLILLTLLGIVAWVMKRGGWPRAPLLIGAVLSTNLEQRLSISVNRYGLEWLTDPFVIAMAIVSLLVIFGGSKRTVSKDEEMVEGVAAERTGEAMSLAVAIRLSFDVLVIIVFAIAAYASLEWQLSAQVMPLGVAGAGVVFGVANLILDIRRWRIVGFGFVNADRGDVTKVAEADEDAAAAAESAEIRTGLRYIAWLIAYLIAMWIAGALIASALFLALFMRLEGRLSWTFTVVGTLTAIAAIVALANLLGLQLPSSLLGL